MNRFFLAFIASVFGATDNCQIYYDEAKAMCEIEPTAYEYVAAISVTRENYRNYCGRCLNVWNTKGDTVRAHIIDSYEGTDEHRLLPGKRLYEKLGGDKIHWQFVDCNTGKGDATFTWTLDSNEWWSSLKMLNIPNGIKKVTATSDVKTASITMDQANSAAFSGLGPVFSVIITTYADKNITLSNLKPQNGLKVDPSMVSQPL